MKQQKTIKFNGLSKERQLQLPLSLPEQEKAIEAINYLLENDNGNIAETYFNTLQKLIDDYQNLCHYRSYTSGLWATDIEPDDSSSLYQLMSGYFQLLASKSI